jgi:hypothetical protein
MEKNDLFKDYNDTYKYCCPTCQWCGINIQSLTKHVRDRHPFSDEPVDQRGSRETDTNNDVLSDSALEKLLNDLSDESLSNESVMLQDFLSNEKSQSVANVDLQESHKREAKNDLSEIKDDDTYSSVVIGEDFERLYFEDISSIDDSFSSVESDTDIVDDETISSEESQASSDGDSKSFVQSISGKSKVDHVRNLDDQADFGDDILLRLKQKHEKFKQKCSAELPTEIEASVKLLNLIKTANAPLNLYERIFTWAEESFRKENTIFLGNHMKRDKVFEFLNKRYGMNDIHPKEEEITLPSGRKIKVVTHDVIESIYSLLTDDDLMKGSNLVMKKDSPWEPIDFDHDEIGDLHTGSLFKMGFETYCTDKKGKDVLCCFVFFIDKTHTDKKGNLTLEPVTITLSIFRRDVRNRDDSWRTIGYIPNLEKDYQYKDTDEKYNDYHAVLRHILKPIVQIQKLGGLKWKWKTKNDSEKSIVLQMPVWNFLGDTEGQDKLCGRIACRNLMVNCICRYCNTETKECDNPDVDFEHTKMKQMNLIQRNRRENDLKKWSYYGIDNATHDLMYCDQERGIHGACPFEIVHTCQLGLNVYAQTGFFTTKQQPANIKKRNQSKRAMHTEVQNANEATVNLPEEQPKTNRNVFDVKFSKKFDELSKFWGKQLRQQSDRNLPRTYFSQGILPSYDAKQRNRKKFNAHEYQGCMIVTLCTMISGMQDEYFNRLGPERYADYISLYEKLIMLENLLQSNHLSKTDMKFIENYIPQLMDAFSRTVDRQSGMGHKFVKFHLFCI